jgi:hypothetical protein
MAFAIMGGPLAATLLTLVFLPAVYFAWFGGRRAEGGRAPARTREPAAPMEAR